MVVMHHSNVGSFLHWYCLPFPHTVGCRDDGIPGTDFRDGRDLTSGMKHFVEC